MLMPKRTKYRKQFRGRMKGTASRGNKVQFEEFGLQTLGAAWITSRQIEAARRAIVRYVKRGGKLMIRIFPDKPVTKKAAETRMGSGKGAVDHWVAVVRPGQVMFEMSGVTELVAREAFRLASHKLPIPTQFVTRAQFELGPGTIGQQVRTAPGVHGTHGYGVPDAASEDGAGEATETGHEDVIGEATKAGHDVDAGEATELADSAKPPDGRKGGE